MRDKTRHNFRIISILLTAVLVLGLWAPAMAQPAVCTVLTGDLVSPGISGGPDVASPTSLPDATTAGGVLAFDSDSLPTPAGAGTENSATPAGGVTWTQIENAEAGVMLPLLNPVESPAPALGHEGPALGSQYNGPAPAPEYEGSEYVRVSIFLSGKSTLDAGYSAEDIAQSDRSALRYRSALKAKQDTLSETISKTVLQGKPLDVVWNLTLAENAISALIPYDAIELIKNLKGVTDVVIEPQYEPCVYSEGGNDPNMATSSSMIGSAQAWASGYTGAGMRIAIIDTGLDTDHQSFASDAYLYSLAQNASNSAISFEEYKNSLDLLGAKDIAAQWENLNISKKISGESITARIYVNEKVPFGANYVDSDLDITHDNDGQGEHGSHVAGISAANSYISDGSGGFVSALDTVRTQGVAPDAQIIVMKVFGKNGGAYDTDYIAAIEDALVLGADAVNLSLGSSNPGFATSFEEKHKNIFDTLAGSDSVIVASAGNSGTWADSTEYGHLYVDGVSLDTVGSPASYTNAFSVASVNNDGSTGNYIELGENKEHKIFITPPSGIILPSITTLAGEHEYIYIDDTGSAEEFEALKENVSGKIAICNRGSSSFVEKATAAVSAGAIACIIVNNQPGTIGMAMDGFTGNIPCVSVMQSSRPLLTAAAITSASITIEGDVPATVNYYLGKLNVADSIGSMQYDSAYYSMSNFSSFGVPGSLELKPEITAPGGNIYSVDGKDPSGRAYEVMSGTSMAAPQIAGMSGLMIQYIEKTNLKTATGLSARRLTQSLLMSTATPLIDENSGSYYPVIQQGAGLANVDKAINAESYIMMGEDATKSAADGKIKAELGDDPERTGEYSFSFTLNNLTDKEKTFELDSKFFTQDKSEYEGTVFMNISTVSIGAITTYSVNGAQIAAPAPNRLTLPASSSAAITVSVELTDDIKQYDYKGAYVEGYVFAREVLPEEGATGDIHSIPVLAYYGGWDESSMFDIGSAIDYKHETETRNPYMYAALGERSYNNNAYIIHRAEDGKNYYFGGNPFVADSEYLPARNAINNQNGDFISGINTSVVRNAVKSHLSITAVTPGAIGTSETLVEEIGGYVGSAFYNGGVSKWDNTSNVVSLPRLPQDLSENTNLTYKYTLAPEYYLKDDGSVEWDSLNEACSLAMPLTIDNTSPQILEITTKNNLIEGGTSLEVSVKDNQYIAAAALFDSEGTRLGISGAAISADAGDVVTYSFPLESITSGKYLLQVYDYALNYASYKLNLNPGEAEGEISVALSESQIELSPGGRRTLIATVSPWGTPNETVSWQSGNEAVASVDANGVVTALSVGTATITVAANADPTKTASCSVTVSTLPITVNGVLMDTEGKTIAYSWNMETESTWKTITAPAVDSVCAYTYDEKNNIAYIQNVQGYAYALNPDTWEVSQQSEAPLPLIMDDLAIPYETNKRDEKNTFFGVYGSYLMFVSDFIGGEVPSYWALSSLLSQVGSSRLTCIAWGGVDSEGKDLIFALDNKCVMWKFSYDGNTLMIESTYDTDLNLTWPRIDDYQNCSLVKGNDNNFYLSYFTGGANELYQLCFEEDSEDIEKSVFSSRFAGTFGENVWPCALGAVNANKPAPQPSHPGYYDSGSAVIITPPKKDLTMSDFCTDVVPEDYYYDAVLWAYENGICAGTDETHFSPKASVTRAQVVTFLWRAAGKPALDTAETGAAQSFADVKPGSYYEPAVAWAAKQGITSGTSKSTFSPDAVCSRAQIVTFLARYAGIKDNAPGYTHSFADVKSGSYYEPAVAWAAKQGITSGTSETTFSPASNCLRAQIVTFLYRYFTNSL